MAKPLKRTATRRAQTSLVSGRRRVKAAERVVTGLVADMLRGQGIVPAAAGKMARSGGRMAGGLEPDVAKAAIAAAVTAAAATPAPLGLTADATVLLSQGAQSFGDVLRAIGNAVVVSQAALDEAAIDTAKQLSQTKLQVAVAIRQNLDADGNLDGDPTIDARTLSLSSFILPTLHQWQHVAASMDLTVSELDATAGIKVKSGGASAPVSTGAVGFSAAAAFNYSSIDAESRFKEDFSTGAVRMDALLGPREEFRFPDVADFAIGPQILVTQTATAGPAVPAVPANPPNPGVPAKAAFRTVKLAIKLVDSLGHTLTGKSIEVGLPPDLLRRLQNWTTGTIQTSAGVTIDLDAKFVAEPTQDYRVQLKYGDLTKIVDVTI